MYTDTIADLLTRIRNAVQARQEKTTAPYSQFKHEICKLLVQKKFLKGVKKVDQGHGLLEIDLGPARDFPLAFKRVSKSGQRIYMKAKQFKNIKNGIGIQVVSTSHGLMTGMEARKKQLGGEVICEIS